MQQCFGTDIYSNSPNGAKNYHDCVTFKSVYLNVTLAGRGSCEEGPGGLVNHTTVTTDRYLPDRPLPGHVINRTNMSCDTSCDLGTFTQNQQQILILLSIS